MYIESEGKSPEMLANAIERGHLQLAELPISLRSNVAAVLEKREKEKKDDKISFTSKAVSSEPKAAKKAATGTTKKAAAKAKK